MAKSEMKQVVFLLLELPKEFQMPCGKVKREQIGIKDVPCPCGNPSHWLVKVVEVE